MKQSCCKIARFLCVLSLLGTWYTGMSASLAQSEPAAETAAPREDRVTYGPALPRSVHPWNPQPAIALVGQIQKLDQQTIEVVTSAGKTHTFPSDRIEQIEVAWASPAAAAAHARFARQQYAEALKENDEILRAGGIPKWQQCILLAELVESAEAVGKPELAGKLFLALAQQSPPDFLIACAPFNWTSRELTPPLEKAAREWLSQSDEYAGLLGASWLLLSEQGEAAKQRLQKLRASESKLIQRMAAMQLWRATPPSATTGEIERWMQARDSLLLPLQLGPTESMAERFARIDKSSLAVGEWLRIAATHGQHPYRVRLALEQARARLARSADDAQAERVAQWLAELAGEQ